jgi:uncharacterized membrane protein
VSFAIITLCVSQRVFIVVVYFVIDSIRKLLDIASSKRARRVASLVRQPAELSVQ